MSAAKHVVIAASKTDGRRYMEELGLNRYGTVIATPQTGSAGLVGVRVSDIHVSLPAQIQPATQTLIEAATAGLIPQTEFEA